jgi:hypothetical protein
MKFIKTGIAAFAAVLLLALPAGANAAGEMLDANFSMTPQSGDFLTNGFKAANWEIENTVTVPPANPSILPSKSIALDFPASQMTFNPGNLPVCPSSQVGPPPVDVSVPVPTIIARCPDSILGNGTAKFALAQNKALLLDGVLVAFNGGLNNGGLPVVKVYAYSYDTNVGIYTEAVYQNGNLDFNNIPVLTADSSVTSLNLAIPSEEITLNDWGPGDETVVLPKGQKTDYVQAKCSAGEWAWSAEFTHGTRDNNGNATSPETFSTDAGVTPCTGVVGKAKIGSVKVTGPGNVKRNKSTTYRVAIKNTGVVNATGVRLRLSGRGIAVNSGVGSIAPGQTRTVNVRVKFRNKGKIRTAFRVTANSTPSKTVNRTITVR